MWRDINEAKGVYFAVFSCWYFFSTTTNAFLINQVWERLNLKMAQVIDDLFFTLICCRKNYIDKT